MTFPWFGIHLEYIFGYISFECIECCLELILKNVYPDILMIDLISVLEYEIIIYIWYQMLPENSVRYKVPD